MRCYKMPDKDTSKGVCWKYALACLLNVSPKKVPHFVSKKSDSYTAKTRAWLKRKFKKCIVFIPSNQFMETGRIKYNPSGGPNGYSIMVISTDSDKTSHAVIAKDGKFFFDPAESDNDTFRTIIGYFVLYNL